MKWETHPTLSNTVVHRKKKKPPNQHTVDTDGIVFHKMNCTRSNTIFQVSNIAITTKTN